MPAIASSALSTRRLVAWQPPRACIGRCSGPACAQGEFFGRCDHGKAQSASRGNGFEELDVDEGPTGVNDHFTEITLIDPYDKLQTKTGSKIKDHLGQSAVRAEIGKALKSLAALGFVELEGEKRVRLMEAVLRFADHVRGSEDQGDALRRLILEGRAEAISESEAGAEDSPQ